MDALTSIITFLVLFVVGTAATALAILLTILIIVYTYKAAKLLVSMLNAAIAEPEAAIVRKTQNLNIQAAKKSAKKNKKGYPAAHVEPPHKWPTKKAAKKKNGKK